MPDAPGLELIRGEIEQDHPGAVLDTSFDRGQAALVVDPEQVLGVLGWLRDAPGQGYRFLSSLHVADYLPAEPRFGVHYELLESGSGGAGAGESDAGSTLARMRCRSIDSCVELFPDGGVSGAGGLRLLWDCLSGSS